MVDIAHNVAYSIVKEYWPNSTDLPGPRQHVSSRQQVRRSLSLTSGLLPIDLCVDKQTKNQRFGHANID